MHIQMTCFLPPFCYWLHFIATWTSLTHAAGWCNQMRIVNFVHLLFCIENDSPHRLVWKQMHSLLAVIKKKSQINYIVTCLFSAYWIMKLKIENLFYGFQRSVLQSFSNFPVLPGKLWTQKFMANRYYYHKTINL